ncbi:hypothetical protein F0562_024889 [Nyssa sinensis]|uniref:Uncharacterized protein n=1 Tax=Nyssa sinensis TaxID=561372 RepID=A0A5J5BD32_9ASTE|nr:hypothetical protein F0562_024889 [Nyssa sinensis]
MRQLPSESVPQNPIPKPPLPSLNNGSSKRPLITPLDDVQKKRKKKRRFVYQQQSNYQSYSRSVPPSPPPPPPPWCFHPSYVCQCLVPPPNAGLVASFYGAPASHPWVGILPSTPFLQTYVPPYGIPVMNPAFELVWDQPVQIQGPGQRTKSGITMAGTFLRLLVVILLGFAHLVCLNAVPITRTESLMHGSQGHEVLLENAHLENTQKRWEMKTIPGRMDVELNDYPGSGANNRHTPGKA